MTEFGTVNQLMGWPKSMIVHAFRARRELMPSLAGIHLQHKEPPVGLLETQAGFAGSSSW